jgi:hypothetical protein
MHSLAFKADQALKAVHGNQAATQSQRKLAFCFSALLLLSNL